MPAPGPRPFSSSAAGSLGIAIAAMIWATDALVRVPALGTSDPAFIVLAEHLVALAVLVPWILFRHGRKALNLTRLQWGMAAYTGIAGSALATVLFTLSFRYVNPSVAILLQKLQPVVVIALAFLFLGERPVRGYFLWGPVALVSGILLSFPEFLRNPSQALSGEAWIGMRSLGAAAAAGAAALWATTTIAGKVLTQGIDPAVATLWRFVFALLSLVPWVALAPSPQPWEEALRWPLGGALLYMGLGPGLAAMIAYYWGMKRTQASIVTLVELLYPFCAVLMNALFLGYPLDAVQIFAGLALVGSVTKLSLAR